MSDMEPCGCPEGEGHTCRPPWVDEDDWADWLGVDEVAQ